MELREKEGRENNEGMIAGRILDSGVILDALSVWLRFCRLSCCDKSIPSFTGSLAGMKVAFSLKLSFMSFARAIILPVTEGVKGVKYGPTWH